LMFEQRGVGHGQAFLLNRAIDSTWVVCGNMSMMPAASSV
jgi:hypothetical protein